MGLAVAVGVLAGAYAVGDSVRQSLREIAVGRLGQTQHALISNQFFREALAPDAPLIALEAMVTHEGSGRHASKVHLYAVDRRFFEFNQVAVHPPAAGEVLLSAALARELDARADDALLVRIPRVSAIPVESLHGQKEDPGRTFRTRLREVVAREFSLRPTQGEIRAVYFPLERLQRELGLGKRVNTALLARPLDVQANYRLEDIGHGRRGRVLTQESMIFSDALVAAVRAVEPAAEPVYTYLANQMRTAQGAIPYSLVAAMDRPDLPEETSIVLNDWAARELRAKKGDSVEITYYLWEPDGRLVERSAAFRVAAVVPVEPADRDLAPEYPGISDVESMADWDPPFPLDLGRIRPQDEKYWDTYRATPKAYIRLAAGERLWRTRYGAVTALRLPDSFDADKLRAALDPSQHGLSQVNVREEALRAARGATDFGEYFLYFSFFLIVSALLLTGLLFRFGLEQRAREIDTLRAVGFSTGALRRLFLTEGLLLALAGGVLGVGGAAVYAGLIVTGLRTWWIDAVGTRAITLHVSPVALALAAGAAVAIAPLVILPALRTRRERGVWLPHPALAAAAGVALLWVGGPGGFFGAGFLLLSAALLALRRWLGSARSRIRSAAGLGLRYTAHRPARSVLCVALIAAATFLIVSVDSFRRSGGGSEGPYRYYGESAIPLYVDPSTMESVPKARWLKFRLRPGDDASCLNLYAPQNPRVLGVPASYLAIPDGAAWVDSNTLTYVLHKKVGEEIEAGGARFRIGRALTDSVFQSEVLISDATFQRAYPGEGGFRVFLVDAPEGADAALEQALSDYGLDLTPVAARKEAFHRVENTYLSTFQSLGALGLVLGTLGLGAVLLRNVLERRRELALLRAVGFEPGHLAKMILAEALFLLLAGLLTGTAAALVAVLPTVWERGGSPPYGSVAMLTAGVLAAGLAGSYAAVRALRRDPLVDALRSEG